MNTCRLLLVAALLFTMTACSGKKAADTNEQQAGGVIPQAQLDALNKAKNVENVMMQDAQRQRDQAEQQSQ